MQVYLIIFLVVFLTNTVPFFMPATWVVLSFIAIRFNVPVLQLAIVGAVAATLGRLTLAKLSRVVIRQQFLSEKMRKNIDDIKEHLEKRKKLTISLFFLYFFSPFPSSQLFVAYGLTNMNLGLLVVPFFIGRAFSYTTITFSADKIAERFMPKSLTSYFGAYFIVVQLVTIALIYLFVKIDWHKLFTKRKVTLIK